MPERLGKALGGQPDVADSDEESATEDKADPQGQEKEAEGRDSCLLKRKKQESGDPGEKARRGKGREESKAEHIQEGQEAGSAPKRSKVLGGLEAFRNFAKELRAKLTAQGLRGQEREKLILLRWKEHAAEQLAGKEDYPEDKGKAIRKGAKKSRDDEKKVEADEGQQDNGKTIKKGEAINKGASKNEDKEEEEEAKAVEGQQGHEEKGKAIKRGTKRSKDKEMEAKSDEGQKGDQSQKKGNQDKAVKKGVWHEYKAFFRAENKRLQEQGVCSADRPQVINAKWKEHPLRLEWLNSLTPSERSKRRLA